MRSRSGRGSGGWHPAVFGAFFGAFAAGAAGGALAWAVRDVRSALGARHPGAGDPRITRSAHFRDGRFHNPVPAAIVPPGTRRELLRELILGKQRRRPSATVPVVGPAVGADAPAAADRLYVTWYGHSTALVQLDGRSVLFDPIWSERCSPSRLVGPRRLHPPPVPLHRLPRLDAVVISHDHYDHLDMATVRALVAGQSAPFLVPLGVGAHLRSWY